MILEFSFILLLEKHISLGKDDKPHKLLMTIHIFWELNWRWDWYFNIGKQTNCHKIF